LPQPNRPSQSGPPKAATDFNMIKPVRFPFEVGQMVSHRAEPDSRGVVVALVFTPTGCTVEVSWGPSHDELNWHFSLERHSGHDEDDDHTPSQSRDFPWAWGQRVRHRANRDAGVVTGYRICERGISARVAWAPDQCDWHDLCELRVEDTA
jgi:hypothetical protein